MKLRFTIMGRSYDTASQLPQEIELGEGSTVDDALMAVNSLLPDNQALPSSCLVVVTGNHLGTVAQHDNPTVSAADELVLIAPVAGG